MKTVIQSLLACAAFYLAVVVGTGGDTMKKSSDELPAIDVKVAFKNGSNPTMQIALTNRGRTEVELFTHWLPWFSALSMNVMAMRAEGSQEPLMDAWAGRILDPLPQRHTLKPNETLKGEIDLKDRFPGLQDALSESGVDVFWTYQPKDAKGRQLKRMGGWLYISKS